MVVALEARKGWSTRGSWRGTRRAHTLSRRYLSAMCRTRSIAGTEKENDEDETSANFYSVTMYQATFFFGSGKIITRPGAHWSSMSTVVSAGPVSLSAIGMTLELSGLLSAPFFSSSLSRTIPTSFSSEFRQESRPRLDFPPMAHIYPSTAQTRVRRQPA